MPARLIGEVPLSGTERARRHREGLRARIAGLEADNARLAREVAQLRELLSVAMEAADFAMRIPRAFKSSV